MSDLVRATIEVAISTVLVGLSVLAQVSDVDVPITNWLTAGAGLVGLVAIGQMVRAISRTEAQKTEVVDALQKQLEATIAENRLLRDEILELIRSTGGQD